MNHLPEIPEGAPVVGEEYFSATQALPPVIFRRDGPAASACRCLDLSRLYSQTDNRRLVRAKTFPESFADGLSPAF